MVSLSLEPPRLLAASAPLLGLMACSSLIARPFNTWAWSDLIAVSASSLKELRCKKKV